MQTKQPTRCLWVLLLSLGLSWLSLTGASAQPSSTDMPATLPSSMRVMFAEPADPVQRATVAGTPRVPVATLDDLRRELRPGDVVSIVQTTGEATRGRVLRIGTSVLEIRARAVDATGRKGEHLDLTIPLSDLQSLERPRDAWTNGTLIGLGVGAGIGAGLFIHAMAIDRNEMDEWAAGYVAGTALLAGIGALVGWGIDAVHSKPTLHYDVARGARMSVRVAPMAPRGPGMALVVSF